jgi:hypothetical protein
LLGFSWNTVIFECYAASLAFEAGKRGIIYRFDGIYAYNIESSIKLAFMVEGSGEI